MDLRFEVAVQVEYLDRGIVGEPSCIRRLDPSVRAFEKGRAKLAFELLHLHARPGGADVEPAHAGGYAPCFDYLFEDGELFDSGHVASCFR